MTQEAPYTAKYARVTQFLDADSNVTLLTEIGPKESPVGKFGFPFQSGVVPRWQSLKPVLTVPDLADSIEQMLARRAAGVPETVAARTQRIYPTDPATIKEAGQVLESLKQSAEVELQAVNAQIELSKKEAARAAKEAAKEAELFEQFKRNGVKNEETVFSRKVG